MGALKGWLAVCIVCFMGSCDAMLECGLKGQLKKCDPAKNEILCHNTAKTSECSSLADCLDKCDGKDCCCTQKWDEDFGKCKTEWMKENKTRAELVCAGLETLCPMTEHYKAYCWINDKGTQGCSNVAPAQKEKVCKCAANYCNQDKDSCRSFRMTCGSGVMTENPYSDFDECVNDFRQVSCLMTKTEGPKCATAEDCWSKCPKGAKDCCCDTGLFNASLTFNNDCYAAWQGFYTSFPPSEIHCMKDNAVVECKKATGFHAVCGISEKKPMGCFHNIKQCEQEMGYKGCCCEHPDKCNKDMDTCMKNRPVTTTTYSKPLKSGAFNAGPMKWVVAGTVGLAIAGLA